MVFIDNLRKTSELISVNKNGEMNMIYYRILLLYRNIPVSVRKSSIFTIKSTTDQVLLPR